MSNTYLDIYYIINRNTLKKNKNGDLYYKPMFN